MARNLLISGKMKVVSPGDQRRVASKLAAVALALAAACSSSKASSPDTGTTPANPDAGAFGCNVSVPFGGCSPVQLGLVCVIDPADDKARAGVAIGCACLPGDGGPAWQCGPPGICTGALGGPCPPESIAPVAAIGGCRFQPRTVCLCVADDAGAGAAWNCSEAP